MATKKPRGARGKYNCNSDDSKMMYNGYRYTREKCRITAGGLSKFYWKCAQKDCNQRIHECPKGNFIDTGNPHLCNYSPEKKAKDAALDRLRELAYSASEGTMASEILKTVLNEMPAESRHVLGSKESLEKRIRRWMHLSRISSGSTYTPKTLKEWAEYCEQSGEEEQETEETIDENEVVASGKINFEPVTLAEVIDPETGGAKPYSGLVFLKQRVDGHNRAMFGGQIFGWKEDVQKGVQLYVCREAKRGCKAHIILYMKQKRYQVKGGHHHDGRQQSSASKRCIPNLKLVDDDGNEIRGATMEDLFSDDPFANNQQDFEPSAGQKQDLKSTVQQEISAGADEDFEGCAGGDDFQMDDFDVNHGDEPCITTTTSLAEALQHQSTTASERQPDKLMEKLASSSSDFKTLPSDAAVRSKPTTRNQSARKTGERCCVCGDELVDSEALACNEETFRKACRYLNVRSEREWFPKSADGQFHSFCDLCSKEIMRIHDLYKKVEEIQTMIFEKVEGVEKRVVDAEIVDTWMNAAPKSTLRRFEGFRKQVIINYCNKLKLRRHVREGRKTGQNLSEAMPVITPQMFATYPSDSSETDSNRKVVLTEDSVGANVTDSLVPEPLQRRRGRPKSKKTQEELSEASSRTQRRKRLVSSSKSEYENDASFQDFDDDARSVASEKEVKFWHDDPKKLKVGGDDTTNADDQDNNYDHFGDDFGGSDVGDDPLPAAEDIEEQRDGKCSDPDYTPDNNRTSTKKKKSKLSSVKPMSKAKHDTEVCSQGSTTTSTSLKPVRLETGPDKLKQPASTANASQKNESIKKKRPNSSFEFPETILRRDGRIFMQGVEIIKNPPGHYPTRPFSASFTCGDCGKIELSFWKVRQHICGHHLGMFKCKVCHKEYSEPKMVERHMEMEHMYPGRMFNCTVCEKPFKIEKTMQFHMWSHLNEEEKKDPANQKYNPSSTTGSGHSTSGFQTFMCSFCSKTFSRPAALKRHELTHSEEPLLLQCQYCGKLCKTKKLLWGHVSKCSKKSMGIIDNTTYPCSKCPVRFKSRGARSKHMRKFHRNATTLPFSCPKCPRAFSTKSAFKNHRRVCTEVSGASTSEEKGQTGEYPMEFKSDPTDQNVSNPSSGGSMAECSYNMFSHPGASLFSGQPQQSHYHHGM